MKGAALVIVMLVIWYFAGMFHQVQMMVLSVCLLLLPVCLIVLTIIQRWHLKITLHRPQSIAFKKIEKEVAVLAENTLRLPVNRFRLRMQLRYTTDKKPVRKKLSGCAGSRLMNDENLSYLYLQAPYCGVITVDLTRVTVYDPLSIFSSHGKLHETGRILVFPVEKQMRILMPMTGRYDNLPVAETHSNKPGDDHSEVRLIREYHPGDLTRHIHRNYSARTDTLWVKEFSKENDYIFDLMLDTSFENIATDDWDAFYEIVFSTLITLLRMDIYINVHWFDRNKHGITAFQVTNESECAEMLAQLYLADKQCKTDDLYSHLDPSQEGLMIINTHLEWFFSGNPVYRFHKDKIEEELSTLSFRL